MDNFPFDIGTVNVLERLALFAPEIDFKFNLKERFATFKRPIIRLVVKLPPTQDKAMVNTGRLPVIFHQSKRLKFNAQSFGDLKEQDTEKILRTFLGLKHLIYYKGLKH